MEIRGAIERAISTASGERDFLLRGAYKIGIAYVVAELAVDPNLTKREADWITQVLSILEQAND